MQNPLKLFVLTAVGFTASATFTHIATAEEHHAHHDHSCEPGAECLSSIPVEAAPQDENVPFGTYSYRHGYLHSLGVIDRLLKLTKKSCCDGGEGGECRATELSIDNRYFKHGDMWCPLTTGQQINTNVGLPHDVQAVVCASFSSPDVCPASSYCVGATFSG